MAESWSTDLIIAGGGLAGGLTAWRLAETFPDLRVMVIERDPCLGGNHTWSFFDTDVTPEQRSFIAPLVIKSWPEYTVRFPSRQRTVATAYNSISSERFHTVLAAALGQRIRSGTGIRDLGDTHVTLETGERLTAPCVLDARGVRSIPHLALGFQKFVGVEYRLAEPHGLAGPIIMDATVPQVDGYRFVYTLPLAKDRVLIEDTTYSDGPELPTESIQERLPAYAREQGWNIAGIERVENGVLPIILAGDLDAMERDERPGPPRIGLAGAFFHPTTGYSLPDALRVADEIVRILSDGPRTTSQVRESLTRYRRRMWTERSYFRWLNRLLFQAGQPEKRYKIIERFYGFDTDMMQRFYACSLTRADQIRLMVGKPPVPILSALYRVSEPAALRRWKQQR